MRGEPKAPDRKNIFEKVKPPKTNDSLYVNDYIDWGYIPPPKSVMPANPKTMARGLPFFGKPVSEDYGDFKGLNEKPINVDRNDKSR